jgi:predicted metalloprotease with PDZ domain
VLRGESNKQYNRMAIRDYFIRFNTSIRKFWNDYTDPCFSLILQPFLEADHSISGVAFANGFIGKYKADTLLNTQRIFVISHEIGHHWLGHRLEMNISHQWFGEGFNDYITFYTLVSCGLITPQDFENKMNEVFKSHYISDIRNTPNDSVFKNYWKMGDYNRLPYRRGAIFAFYLDCQIRLISQGAKSIRDLLRALALFRKEKPSDYEITLDDFIEQAAYFLPRDQVKSDLDAYILKGNPILFNTKMFTSDYQLIDELGIPQIKIVNEKKFMAMFN